MQYVRGFADHRVSNIQFLEGDILELNSFPEKFDVIECTGVLHHLADPLAGWQALISRLAPGGVMKIGLYSESARRHVTEVRQWIKQQGHAPTAKGIRQTRQEILALPQGDSKREVTSFSDFYSISGARDLLFHVQESTFTFPKIASALGDLGLEFIGLQITDSDLKNRYSALFPDDFRMNNLSNWHKLENGFPDSFRQMYIFWCRQSG